jgi:hypothetical protein
MLTLNNNQITPRRFMKPLLVVVFIIFLSVYIYFQFNRFLRGPSLSNISVSNNSVVTDSLLPVSGTLTNVDFAWLNGRQIFTNPRGEFEEDVLLLPGYNIIELRARDRFGRSFSKRFEIVLNETPRSAESYEKPLMRARNAEHSSQSHATTSTTSLPSSDITR